MHYPIICDKTNPKTANSQRYPDKILGNGFIFLIKCGLRSPTIILRQLNAITVRNLFSDKRWSSIT